MFLENFSELSRWSREEVMVVCDFQKSEKCLVKVIVRYCNARINIDRNNGSYICRSCSMMRLSGRNASNCKYKELDDHLMDVIDSEAKAYLLGWIASDGWLHENGTVGIGVNIRDIDVLEVLRDFICPDLPIADYDKSMKRLLIYSNQWYKSIQGHLNLGFKKGDSHNKSYLVQMPIDISDSLKWCFLRGLFEGDGCVSITKNIRCQVNGLRVDISSRSLAMKMMIVTFCRSTNINIYMSPKQVTLSGQYAARFLEKIYAECNGKFVLKRKYNIYKQLKNELSRFWDRAAVAEKAYLTARMENITIT